MDRRTERRKRLAAQRNAARLPERETLPCGCVRVRVTAAERGLPGTAAWVEVRLCEEHSEEESDGK